METHLDGTVVVVTGATGGLGAALAARLAAAGARLVLVGRRREALEELAASLPAPTSVNLVTGDLSFPGVAVTVAGEIESAFGRVDVLVNNAGVGYFALAQEATPETTRMVFEVNTLSPWELARAVAPGMAARGCGLIVNVVSCMGRVPVPTTSVYGGSKSALATMANTMRLELAGVGVGVLNVYPGTVATSFEAHAFRESGRPGTCLSGCCGHSVEWAVEKLVAAIARRRTGELWLSRRGRLLAALGILWPGYVDRVLRRIREWALARPTAHPPAEERRWRLWQVESSLACNLRCVMCPWTAARCDAEDRGLMSQVVWDAIRPHLESVAMVDFTGGGEPLLNPRLFDWIDDARAAGCCTGFLTNGMRLDAEAVRRALAAGVGWIAVSIDGATREVYERHRPGASFDTVCAHVRHLTASRAAGKPRVGINFVMMPDNVHQLEEMVRLVAGLGADVLNLKQADVVRGAHGKGYALFGGPSVEVLERRVRRARRLGRRLGLEVVAARFVPDEEAVCEQDPRDSLFVRWDGTMSPCISLAIGGPTTFLGREVVMPTVTYGRLPDDDPRDTWERPPCSDYRRVFDERERVFAEKLADVEIGASLLSLQEALEAARKAMPAPPDGCRHCHYLYGL